MSQAAENPGNGLTVNFYRFKSEVQAIADAEGCAFGDVVRRAVARGIDRCRRAQRRFEQQTPARSRRSAGRVS